VSVEIKVRAKVPGRWRPDNSGLANWPSPNAAGPRSTRS